MENVYVYDELIGRLHDLDGYLGLLRLRLNLRLEDVPAEKIPAFIQRQGMTPGGSPTDFKWNAETGTISFQPYSRQDSFAPYLPASSVARNGQALNPVAIALPARSSKGRWPVASQGAARHPQRFAGDARAWARLPQNCRQRYIAAHFSLPKRPFR